MKTKPIIGISGNIMMDEGGMFPGFERAYVNQNYCQAIASNGGIPIIIPVTGDADIIKEQMGMVDALLLSGGQDISPAAYGALPRPLLGDISPQRDAFDFALLAFAVGRQIPVLGVCRGHQLMNVHFGGALHQNLSYIISENEIMKHWQGHGPSIATHPINIVNQSILAQVFWEETILVNSFHRQCVDRLAEGFTVAAIAPDGVIESIQKTDYPFMVGVQWHPEMLFSANEGMSRLFERLIKEAGQQLIEAIK